MAWNQKKRFVIFTAKRMSHLLRRFERWRRAKRSLLFRLQKMHLFLRWTSMLFRTSLFPDRYRRLRAFWIWLKKMSFLSALSLSPASPVFPKSWICPPIRKKHLILRKYPPTRRSICSIVMMKWSLMISVSETPPC